MRKTKRRKSFRQQRDELRAILLDTRPYIASFVEDEDREIESELLTRIDTALGLEDKDMIRWITAGVKPLCAACPIKYGHPSRCCRRTAGGQP